MTLVQPQKYQKRAYNIAQMKVQYTIYNKIYTFKVVKHNTLCNYSKKRKYSTLHNANYTLRNDSTSAMTVIHCTITVQWISCNDSTTD